MEEADNIEIELALNDEEDTELDLDDNEMIDKLLKPDEDDLGISFLTKKMKLDDDKGKEKEEKREKKEEKEKKGEKEKKVENEKKGEKEKKEEKEKKVKSKVVIKENIKLLSFPTGILRVREGDRIEINAEIGGSEVPVISWMRRNRKLFHVSKFFSCKHIYHIIFILG